MSNLRQILRGGAIRFVAGAGSVMLLLFLLYVLARATHSRAILPTHLVGFLNLGLCLIAGYFGTLAFLRPSLHSARGIEGIRSVMAGALAMGLLTSVDYISEIVNPGSGMLYANHAPRMVMEIIAFAAGSLSTFGLFFAWINQTEREAAALSDAIGSLGSQPATLSSDKS